jgi:hypothetical protein
VSGGRKSRLRRNLGGTTAQDDPRFADPFFDGPSQAELRTSIVLPERLIRRVLVDEVDRLSGDVDECRRFFSHFFDPTVADIAERESYVKSFIANPPKTTLGYPRTMGEWPIFSITLTSDEETEPAALAKYVGQTLPGEKPPGGEDQEYEGAFWEQTNSVLIMAPHPDQALFLYHFAKLSLFGAREAFVQAGIIDPTYSGGELNPQEVYLPDNAFGRILNISFKVMQTVPKLYTYRDGRRLRVGGIFGSDVVVDGMRGGASTFDPGETNG